MGIDIIHVHLSGVCYVHINIKLLCTDVVVSKISSVSIAVIFLRLQYFRYSYKFILAIS